MAIKELNAASYSATAERLPVLRMVRNDKLTSLIQFNIPRSVNGIDLGGMNWAVNVVNAADEYEAQKCTVKDGGETIVALWTVTGIATSVVGKTQFQLEGTAPDGRVWQSDLYYNEVGESISRAPSYTPAVCGAGVCGDMICGKE